MHLKLEILQYFQYFIQLYSHLLTKLLPFVLSLIISTFINMSNNLHQILQEHYPFRTGDYVIVNNRYYGYVITITNNNVDIKVKYAITNVIQDISVYDCQIASIANDTNIRSGLERHVRTAPPILPNNTTTRLLSSTERLSLTPIQKLKAAIQSARSWKMEEK